MMLKCFHPRTSDKRIIFAMYFHKCISDVLHEDVVYHGQNPQMKLNKIN